MYYKKVLLTIGVLLFPLSMAMVSASTGTTSKAPQSAVSTLPQTAVGADQNPPPTAEPTTPTSQPQSPQTPVAPPKQSATPPAAIPAPKYGEDPQNPGVLVVFDKTTLMDEAGIAAGQQSAANSLIQQYTNWRYRVPGFPDSNLCYVAPIVKMAIAGDDYLTNPVTQLKYCNTYIITRHGNWIDALAYFNINHLL